MTTDDGPDLPSLPDTATREALERTRADLAAHGARTPAMPPGLLADVDAALARERAAEAAPPPVRRTPIVGRVLAVVLAAAAAAVLVVTWVTSGPALPPAPTAAPPAPTAPEVPVLAAGDGPAGLRAALGRSDYGPLADAGRLGGCLAAHGVAAGVRPIGARQVVVDGREGVLLVLPTGVAARFRLLVVEPGCAAGAPLTVSDTLVGR
ncbi:hypothetical protein GCM10023200_39650 [Actinomycetospora chlora]|uniref:Uncharacterized protein n=1 Tax=Actinomycetospora chlora TaxID=663608 RepID=A0ABP9BUP7_9PSEU